jgi:hypothetical protein
VTSALGTPVLAGRRAQGKSAPAGKFLFGSAGGFKQDIKVAAPSPECTNMIFRCLPFAFLIATAAHADTPKPKPVVVTVAKADDTHVR